MSADRDYLAAGLALGGLSDSELDEARALAESDADFRAEVASYEETTALMAESDEPVEVSSATRDAILRIPDDHEQEVIHEQEPAPTSLSDHRDARESDAHADGRADGPADGRADVQGEGRGEAQPRRRSWLPWVAAAAAIIVIAGLGVTVWQQHQRQNALEEDLTATQQQLDESTRLMEADDLRTHTAEIPEGGSVTVLSSESEQLIRLSPRDIGQAPAGKSMQMWVIGDSGPESVGLMSNQPVTIADEEFASGSVFGITVEPEGGSEQPTTDPIVAVDL